MWKYFSFIYLTFIVYAQALSSEEFEKVHTYSQECQRITDVDYNLVEELSTGKVVDDEKVKCFIHCLFKKGRFTNSDGIFQPHIAIEKLSGETGVDITVITNAVEECGRETGSNDCDTAFKIYKCYQDKANAPLV